MSSTSPVGQRSLGALLRGFARWVQPRRHPAAVVFGNVTVAAVCALEASGGHRSPGGVVLAVFGTMLVYWLAHAYSEVAALRLGRRVPWSWQVLREGLRDEWALLEGASIPLVAVLLAWVLGGDAATCASAGFWTAVGSLVLFEAFAARVAGEDLRGVVTGAGVGVTLGLALVVLKNLVA